MGSLLAFTATPSTPGVCDRADDGLSAFMHMDVLHLHLLLAAAPELSSPVTKSLFDQSGSGATMMASMVISPLISAMTANASATSV